VFVFNRRASNNDVSIKMTNDTSKSNWFNWTKEEQERYNTLKSLVQTKHELSPEDWDWFAVRQRTLRFYGGAKNSISARRFAIKAGKDGVVKGYSTKPR